MSWTNTERELHEALRIERKTIAAQEDRIADLLARNAILAAALEKIAIKLGNLDSIDFAHCDPDFTCNMSITVSNGELHAIHNALTVDDRKAGEYLRALEDLAIAAQRAYDRYQEERAAHIGFPRGECAWAMGVDLEEPLNKLAAVRAVKEAKDAE